MMRQGKLIVLNGTSSSGKTSLARAMQATFGQPLLYLGLDTAMGMLPFRYTGDGDRADEGYSLRQMTQNGPAIVRYSIGPHGNFLNNAMACFATDLCSKGYDVVLDHVITNDETIIGLAERVNDRASYLIGLTCESDVVESREHSRGDRVVGLAASQATTVHTGLRHYDLRLDTSHIGAAELAEMVLELVTLTEPFAFAKILRDAGKQRA